MAPSSYYSGYPMYNREPAVRSASGSSSKMLTSAMDGDQSMTPQMRRESRPISRRGSATSHRSRSIHAAAGAKNDVGGRNVRRSVSEVRPSGELAISRRTSWANLSHEKLANTSSQSCKSSRRGGGGGGGAGKSTHGGGGKGGAVDANASYEHYNTPGMGAKPYTNRERCYDQPQRHVRAACNNNFVWDHGKYKRDDCGSGIVPRRFNFLGSRRIWCKTPLSMYQATIGELGRQILCREKVVPRDVKPAPPCNVCEYILPMCHGYYRRYDCLRPCEEEYTSYKNGQKTYRDRVARYWEPCLTQEQKNHLDVNTYAGHNVYLGLRMRRKNVDLPCW